MEEAVRVEGRACWGIVSVSDSGREIRVAEVSNGAGSEIEGRCMLEPEVAAGRWRLEEEFTSAVAREEPESNG